MRRLSVFDNGDVLSVNQRIEVHYQHDSISLRAQYLACHDRG